MIKTNIDFSFFIGDTVWYAWKGDLAPKGYFEEQKIQKINITEDTITYITNENRSFTKDDIGTLFFHSYEEANNIINLTSEIRDAASKLLSCFTNSVFLTDRNPIEFIADKASNTYFIFGNCLTKEEIDCKVLEFLSYSAYKSRPFSSNIKNKEFHAKMLNSINQYLDTNFSEQDMELIYTYLGSRCNHEKTLDFIRNGFNMDVLQNKKEEQIDEKDGIEME